MAHRIGRINEEVKKELSILIKTEIKDPRVSELLSVTDVQVTNDLSYANVFISVYGDEKKQEETIDALKNAGGFLRKEIGKNIRLRYIPELIFKLDNSIEYGMHINSILKDIEKKDED